MYSAVLHDSITCAYIQFWLAIKKQTNKKTEKSVPCHGRALLCKTEWHRRVGHD